ncbi:MAG: DUF2182 domain-containing protein [Rhodospirillales bacterium]|nr:DUF2182 domain-containing protein [Rhodospirillales bacterium]MDH3790893.1 DUF2182 domain-containing protein [Rhodospirillales bacterium]MDH3909964.1 DUF2182 domain-containing protein [Rhodospirillales bacterium]MDH3916758.1 DUF2182 domain-containing protein [Rhodospirillales bacterium]MDH3969098.1 DUF2182 domain-containing protein [Rhodospirillales bacterium]
MTATSLESAARRDRWVVLLSLLGVTTLAWVYLVDMGEMATMAETMTGTRVTAATVVDFLLMFVMWVVMMIGMMLPSASPMILMFARINRNHRNKGEPFVPTGTFVAGYIVVWSGFSFAATALQWGLQEVGLLSPLMASTNAVFGGLVLAASGVYQWTPLKHACLRHCQTPLGFLMTRWRDGAGGAFHMGLSHGAYCVGCCWVLMALLFVGGVMNLLWVAALAAFVFVEKIAPPGCWLPRIAGATLIAWGGWILGSAL